MISVVVVAALVVLALVTQAGVVVLQRVYSAQGKMINVVGATLHVIDIGPRDSAMPPIVIIHGASSNLETMRLPLGDMLAKAHRVILIDRPGHGWSVRAREDDSTPAIQARMIDQALEQLGIGSAVFVVHSWAGALGARLALDYPRRVAGLVMLAPVAYPWRGGVWGTTGWSPRPGSVRCWPIRSRCRSVTCWPSPAPATCSCRRPCPGNYVRDTATLLLLRPREFLANARDLVALKAAVAEQAPRYGDIRTPTLVITGDSDDTVSPNIHSRPFAAAVPGAKLIVLPGVGHMVQNAAPELVMREIDAMIGRDHIAAAN